MPVSLLITLLESFFILFYFVCVSIPIRQICHSLKLPQRTLWSCGRVTRRVEKWEQCGFYRSWAGLRRWVVHHVLPGLLSGTFERPSPSTLILCSFTHKSVVLSTFSAVCLKDLPKKDACRLLCTCVHEAKIFFKVPYYVHFCNPKLQWSTFALLFTLLPS